MNLKKDPYIIAEIIPTRSDPKDGFIAQISALKLKGLKLIDRFDYRVKNRWIENQEIRRMISYDKNLFTYVDNTDFILEKFRQWAKGFPILTVDDTYTPKYFEPLENHQELVFPLLDIENGFDVFDRLRKRYGIEPTPHLVDVVYESIIYHKDSKNPKQKTKEKKEPNS